MRWSILVLALSAACAESNSGAPPPVDSGAQTVADAGSTTADAGPSELPDTGPAEPGDVGSAPMPDAGSMPGDAGSTDRGPVSGDDAGAPDAAVIDAGLVDAGPPSSGPVASQLEITIDRDDSSAPTPINQLYVSEIDATVAGDRIISYQKYFRSEPVISALINAARRGVEVTGIYRDSVEPSCESLLEAADTIDCASMFINSNDAHHKNLMLLRADGTARAIIGSYNPRVRSTSDPRVHTVLSFTVERAQPIFDFYAGEADRLQGGSSAQPLTISMPISGGGELTLSFHPGSGNQVLDLLNGISSCDGTLWLSYFSVLADAIGRPVFDRLQELNDAGCDVRFLLDDSNTLTRISLVGRGIDARFPTFSVGDGTLGHKIVLVRSNGETHLIQSSANLEIFGFNLSHNLTAQVRAPSLPLAADIEAELSRYW